MTSSGAGPIEPNAATAHAFVRRRRGASLARCFARLLAGDGVRACDRVTGGWDLVLRLRAADGAALERLARAHLETFDVEAYELHYGARAPAGDAGPGPEPRSGTHPSAYAVARLDRGAPLAAVHARLRLDEAVVACEPTHDGGEAVLLVRAPTAAQLRRALHRLRAGRGVVALRAFPVVGPPDLTADRHPARPRAAP